MGRRPRTRCRNGHALTEENVKWRKPRVGHFKPERQCLTCLKAANQRINERRKRERELKPSPRTRVKQAIEELWRNTLKHPDRSYAKAMQEAKQEYDEWIERQKTHRGKAITVGKKRRKAA